MGDTKLDNSIGEECQALFASLKAKGIGQDKLAELYFEEGNQNHSKSIASLKVKFSGIATGNFKSKILDTNLLNFLTVLDENTPEKKAYSSQIFFYFWSEGENNNVSEDRLKIAAIKLDLKMLATQGKVQCSLQYETHAEFITGSCKLVHDKKVLSFTFDQGTSFLMCIPNAIKDSKGKYYKGTYAASPDGGYTSCGIALFEVCEKESSFKDIPDEKKERIKAELYKKRFLILSDQAVYSGPAEFKTHSSFNDLKDFETPYIRYRKSLSDGRIHGDFIKIEKFGRVIYHGTETENVYGRCFIQRDVNVQHSKNLIIELYQESDKDKRGFEFRSPHSFMMFDIAISSNIFMGYALRPNSKLKLQGGNCFLIKVDIPGWKEKDFKPLEFEDSMISLKENLKLITGLHSFIKNETEVKQLFDGL